jgi:archaellum component FlaC
MKDMNMTVRDSTLERLFDKIDDIKDKVYNIDTKVEVLDERTCRLDKIEEEVSLLKHERAKLLGFATAIAAVISWLVNLWK